MDRKEALTKFFENDVSGLTYEMLKKLDYNLKKEKQSIAKKLTGEFDNLFELVNQNQENIEPKSVFCVSAQILRSSISNKKSELRLSAYDTEFYMDKNPIYYTFDFDELFKYIFEFENNVAEEVKKYVTRVNKSDVAVAVQKTVMFYKDYLTRLLLFSIEDILRLDSFQELNKEKDFFIFSGEYKDNLDYIYRSADEKTKYEKTELVRKLSSGKDEFYTQLLTDLEFEELDLRNKNLCYTQFTNSKMTLTDFALAYCICTNFSNCFISGTNFENALLHDADFSGATLYGVMFNEAFAGLTTPTEDTFYSPGFRGVNFKNAVLNKVDFTEADFSGADFRGAKFSDVIFENANLENAVFDEDALTYLELSQSQLNSVLSDKSFSEVQ